MLPGHAVASHWHSLWPRVHTPVCLVTSGHHADADPPSSHSPHCSATLPWHPNLVQRCVATTCHPLCSITVYLQMCYVASSSSCTFITVIWWIYSFHDIYLSSTKSLRCAFIQKWQLSKWWKFVTNCVILMEIFQSMDLFVDNSVIMMKLMKLMKMCQFSLFFCKMWTFSVKFSDQVFPDVSHCKT